MVVDEEPLSLDSVGVDTRFESREVFVILELFLELGSESSSSLSVVSFLVDVRLLCLLSAGDPVREPFDVTDEGVPALEEVSFGALEATVGLSFMASEGVGSVVTCFSAAGGCLVEVCCILVADCDVG